MISKEQIIALKTLQRRAHLDDAAYRLMLANVANGATSCKELTQVQYEDVMAFLEDAAGGTDGYWRSKVLNRGTRASSRQVYMIHELYGNYVQAAANAGVPEENQYKLEGLVRDRSGNRTLAAAGLTPSEAWRLTEQLKAIVDRQIEAIDVGPGCPRLSEMRDEDE